jgi:putative ABC transport system ATP-binding protein
LPAEGQSADKREIVVRAEGVVKEYATASGSVRVLDGLDFAARAGEYVSVVGPSGSGKTTLFNLIGALDVPTAGRILVGGEDLGRSTPAALARLRSRKIGYVFQTFNLVAQLTALENVMLPMIFSDTPRRDTRRRAAEILDRVGLGERLAHLPSELSGGQQQRVAIARAFANRPSIILADEPTGNLDPETGVRIIRLLREMNAERRVTILAATHDPNLLEVSDRVVQLRNGRIEAAEPRPAPLECGL